MKSRLVQILLPLSLVGFFWMASAGFGAADSSAAADKNLAADIAALKTQIAQLAHQIQNSADYIAINNLQDAYGYYVDKTKWDEVADLFTDDGSVEIGLRGVYKGKERVRAYMHHLGDLKYGTLFNHSQLQPVVHVDPDGLHAHGRFRAYMQVGTLNSPRAVGRRRLRKRVREGKRRLENQKAPRLLHLLRQLLQRLGPGRRPASRPNPRPPAGRASHRNLQALPGCLHPALPLQKSGHWAMSPVTLSEHSEGWTGGR